ncbi:MAG: hypothetical protein R3282_10670, partial [Rhodothermales bacterium]|nr:hypothetical protein [Rhodothermales bacterium]
MKTSRLIVLLLLSTLTTATAPETARSQSRSELPQSGILSGGGSLDVEQMTKALPSSSRVAAESEILYAVNHATAFTSPDSSQAYIDLDARETVEVLQRAGRWVEVRTTDGAQGF